VSFAGCTVVTRNYLAFARLVGRSWTDHHPRSPFTIVVVDHDGMAPPTWVHRDIRIVGPEALGVSHEQLMAWAAIYSASELACVLKPNAMRLLLEEVDVAVYVDGDVEVLDPMDDLEDLARARGVVLSPHNLHPLPDDQRLPDRFTMLKAGMFNGGLLAVGRNGVGFLDWWARQLDRDGIHEPQDGMHGDQRWLDFVPTYFDHHILRDPTFNVAYWNLHERPTSWDGESLLTGGRRVRSFHYSGLIDEAPWELSQFMGDVPRAELRDLPAVARACRRYLDRLRTADLDADLALGYRFAHAVDGTPVDRRARRLWRDQLLLADADPTGQVTQPPSPFAPDGGAAWLAWLREPAEGRTVSRYLVKVWSESADLQRTYPDLDDPFDRARYLTWVLEQGAEAAEVPITLLPDHQDTVMADSPDTDGRPRRRARRPDVRSQQPLDDLAAARGVLEQKVDERGAPRSVRKVVGRIMAGRDQRHDEVDRHLAEAVDELRQRLTELGDRLNKVNDELPEQAERLDRVEDGTAELQQRHGELADQVDRLEGEVDAEGQRIEGALEQDLITASILADAEARLTAEVADLQLRLDKLADDELLADDAGDDDERGRDRDRKRRKRSAD
jgi:hypothetical protein